MDDSSGLWGAIIGVFATVFGVSRHLNVRLDKIRLELKADGQRLEDRHDAALNKIFEKTEEIKEEIRK